MNHFLLLLLKPLWTCFGISIQREMCRIFDIFSVHIPTWVFRVSKSPKGMDINYLNLNDCAQEHSCDCLHAVPERMIPCNSTFASYLSHKARQPKRPVIITLKFYCPHWSAGCSFRGCKTWICLFYPISIDNQLGFSYFEFKIRLGLSFQKKSCIWTHNLQIHSQES